MRCGEAGLELLGHPPMFRTYMEIVFVINCKINMIIDGKSHLLLRIGAQLELLEIAGISAYQAAQEIGCAFRIKAVIGNAFFSAQPAA